MTERFFIEQKIEEEQSEIVISDVELIHQVSRVLRKKIGDRIVILDNTGFEYECEIRQVAKKLVLLKILKKSENQNEPQIKVSLFQSLLKKQKMEFVFEKCTEIGVLKFIPIVSEHSVKLSLNADRAQKILKEAAEQSQRGRIPEIFNVVKFQDAVSRCEKSDLNILFHEKEKGKNIGDFFLKNQEKIKNSKNINIFIGPEGGFSEQEASIAQESGFEILSLGSRVLRAETAAVISSGFLLI